MGIYRYLFSVVLVLILFTNGIYANPFAISPEDLAVYESYFPDSVEGGKALDALWEAPDKNSRSDEEILDTVRNGLRRTKHYKTLILRWIGNKYIWGQQPQPPRALELMYYASYDSDNHYAVYFGLSVASPKSEKVLRRLAEIALEGKSIGRIVWGVKRSSQKKDFLRILEEYQKKDDPDLRIRATILADIVRGKATEQDFRARNVKSDPDDVESAKVTYEEAFQDLYDTLGKRYPCFQLKNIDWQAVGKEFLPRVKGMDTEEEFGRLCIELVARLEDSHAYLREGTAKVPWPTWPRWDPGFACLEDERERPVIYYVDIEGPAQKAGVKVGMVIVKMNDKPVEEVIQETMQRRRQYIGYSSDRYLRYHAFRFFPRQVEEGTTVAFVMLDSKGKQRSFSLRAEMGSRYLPRLPVPIPGIADSGSVSWKMLDGQIGYIYVRRIRQDLIEKLDKAVGNLKNAKGLIIDVRGNSGGGFDARRALLNFALDKDNEEPERPRYKGTLALVIDSRCISAGEGWASWFIAKKRARVFGEATAGASARKTVYPLKNGLYKVQFPVKAYRGFLDRPIERRGLEPEVPVKPKAQDIAERRDTVLEAAKAYLWNLPATK